MCSADVALPSILLLPEGQLGPEIVALADAEDVHDVAVKTRFQHSKAYLILALLLTPHF